MAHKLVKVRLPNIREEYFVHVNPDNILYVGDGGEDEVKNPLAVIHFVGGSSLRVNEYVQSLVVHIDEAMSSTNE